MRITRTVKGGAHPCSAMRTASRSAGSSNKCSITWKIASSHRLLSHQTSCRARPNESLGSDSRSHRLISSTRTAATGRSVVLTDHPWPDLRIEHSILGAAGYTLVAGPEVAGTAQEVEVLVRQADPIAILTCWAQVSKVAI